MPGEAWLAFPWSWWQELRGRNRSQESIFANERAEARECAGSRHLGPAPRQPALGFLHHDMHGIQEE